MTLNHAFDIFSCRRCGFSCRIIAAQGDIQFVLQHGIQFILQVVDCRDVSEVMNVVNV
jgi:hypothetical protein